MKRNVFFVGILAMVLVVWLMFTGCDTGTGGNIEDSALNGTWGLTQEGMSFEYKFNNGNFEVSINNAPFEKGTYTTSGNKLTINISHVYGQSFLTDIMQIELQARWYTLTEFFNDLKIELGLSDEEWVEMELMIQQQIKTGSIYTYSVSGNILTLTMDLSQIGQTGTQTITLIKK